MPGNGATIQGAIDLAADGDTVLVAPGTYFEQIDFLGKQLVVESEQGAAATTLDAQGAGTVVTMANREPVGTVLRGFTVTGAQGRLTHRDRWPDVPPGTPIYVQAWVVDPTAPLGWAASACLQMTAQNP